VHHPYTAPPAYVSRYEPEPVADLPQTISVEWLEAFNEGCWPWRWPRTPCERRASEAERAHVVNRYDAEIRQMDETLGRFIEGLRALDLYDRTLIVLTSDHGEEFGEHGMMGWHAHSLYDELLRVPLIVKRPRSEGAGTVVDEQVRSLDIAPTILGVLDVEVPATFRGVDLVARLSEVDPPPLLAISQRDAKAGTLPVSIRSPQWKLFDDALFALGEDPTEQVDVAASRPEIAENLSRLRSDAIAGGVSLGDRGAPAAISADTAEQLRALGYLD